MLFTKALGKLASGIGTATLGGGGRRMLTGTAAGALYGGMTADTNDPGGIFRSAVLGGLGGLGIGALTTKTAMSGMWGLAKKTPRMAWRGGVSGARVGAGIAGAAVRNPRTAVALGAGALGMYALATSGPGTSSANPANYAAATGVSSTGFRPGMGSETRQPSDQMFIDSTYGLVQGLHQGRKRF